LQLSLNDGFLQACFLAAWTPVSLEQGPAEERLAKIEATLAANAPGSNGAKGI